MVPARKGMMTKSRKDPGSSARRATPYAPARWGLAVALLQILASSPICAGATDEATPVPADTLRARVPEIPIATNPPASPPDSSTVPCFHRNTPWETPDVFLLSHPVTAKAVFGILVDASFEEWLLNTAASGFQRVLGFGEIDRERGKVVLSREDSDRVIVLRTAGLGGSAEEGVQADYPLWGPLNLRSEVRERGEASMEIRREFRFW